MTDSGKWNEMKAQVLKQFPGLNVSGYRPGSKGSSGQADYHSSGDAVDISPPSMEIFNWIAANFPGSAEIIYTPAGARQIKNGAPHTYSAGVAAGHFDHVHWANPAGGSPTGAASGGSSFGGITSFLSFLGNTSMWARVGVAIGSVILLLIAMSRLTGGKTPTAGQIVKKVTNGGR